MVMIEPTTTHNEIDDYIAQLTRDEREQLVAADAAIDLAMLIYRARERRSLSQTEAARRAGLHQQAISRNERAHVGMKIETLRHYLAALGYQLEIVVRDLESDEIVDNLPLPAGYDSAR